MLRGYRATVFGLALLCAAACGRAEEEEERPVTDEAEMERRLNAMVDSQIEGRGISDPATLDAMRKVPRWEFIPENLRSRAFEDNPLPIGEGQTISQPYIVAYMTEALQLEADDRVLEIGTGSGYQAGILAEIAAEVYTIEIVESLGESARETLERLGYDNVHVHIGDGYAGWPEEAPFDAIIVTCAPDHVPPALLEQLDEGGRLVLPLGGQYPQMLKRYTRRGDDYDEEDLEPVLFVPMTGEAQEK
ncbi:MAG: protein-L-isoaspartate(D-aspartate) O-methyltransferase [Candidatus Zixiibacteriota bacterium]|jgi:protein-L-isoaspartate(D-aspartate) O-methyltransferase